MYICTKLMHTPKKKECSLHIAVGYNYGYIDLLVPLLLNTTKEYI